MYMYIETYICLYLSTYLSICLSLYLSIYVFFSSLRSWSSWRLVARTPPEPSTQRLKSIA